MNNKIMLITYPDSFGKNIKEMSEILNKYFSKAIGSVHILPFFPSSGDRGFAPITYDIVDPVFGTWDDIKSLSKKYEIMADFMINHVSRKSEYFEDFIKKHDLSRYNDMFLRYKNFWPAGEPADKDINLIYKRKPRAPYVEAEFNDGTKEKVWCTFSEEQIDLNLKSKITWDFIEKSLHTIIDGGVSIIRLDAVAFATKKYGTNCFFVEPDIWNIMQRVKNIVDPMGAVLLSEMHEHYKIQLKLAQKGYWVYDFALPMLLLYAIYTGDCKYLKNWLKICPRNQFTTLDTHDGIGVVDVKDLMDDEKIDETVNLLYENGANVKRSYNSAEYNNLDVYQINCTYYSALGDRDDAYLLARAIQFFAPGIPQVYYVGLLAGSNDIELMEKTKSGRNINRHSYTKEEVHNNIERPVVQKLCKLMQFRNEYPAFNGETEIIDTPDNILKIKRKYGEFETILQADMKNCRFDIRCYDPENKYSQLIH